MNKSKVILTIFIIIISFFLISCDEVTSPFAVISIEKVGQNLEGYIYEIKFVDNNSYQFIVPFGTDGENGLTPRIGTNGNWWIGEEDTGIFAQGPQGEQGNSGVNGENGLTPRIGANGNWWIGEEDTGISAQGPQGEQGNSGVNGENGLTPRIGANGNWWIGTVDTGVKAQGSSGTDGKDGITPHIGENGHWWIGDTDTGLFAGEPDVIKQTGEFEFAVNSDGESYYLIKYTGKDRYISIPKTHKGYPVTEIGKEAFKDNTIIETLITNNVKKIEDDAFNGATNLKEVNLTKAESIGTKAFYNCSSLTNVFIPNTVTSIGYSTFDGCSSLKSVIIPNSVTSIGGSLFRDCGILIIYAETSSKLSGWDDNWNISRRFVYWGVKEYDTLNDIDYARLSDDKIIIRGFNPNSLTTDFVLPDTINTYQVTAIQSFAFYNCYSLTSVIIPNSVTSIDIGTFMNCSSLTSITIPNSVTSIGNQAFYYCYSLTSVTIPNSVTSIGYYAFRDCSSLTSIIIPNGVTNIGGAIFSGCSSLTSITIPNSVTRIEGYAFDGCSSLTSIFIPNSVTRIENYTFRNCNSLTIYAEASSKPSEWSSDWNCSNRPVYWGAKR